MFKQFIKDAYKLAQIAYDQGEVPVGCVITHRDRIIAEAYNQVETTSNPNHHAEIIALAAAHAALGEKFLVECDLYVTLEPCAMCAGAISLSRIRRLHFAASDPKSGGVLHGAQVLESSSCHHKPEIIYGEMEEECASLIRKFFQARRDSRK